MNKKQRIIKWANNYRTRSMSKATKETGCNRKQLIAQLSRLKRKGYIDYIITKSGRGELVTFITTKMGMYQHQIYSL